MHQDMKFEIVFWKHETFTSILPSINKDILQIIL